MTRWDAFKRKDLRIMYSVGRATDNEIADGWIPTGNNNGTVTFRHAIDPKRVLILAFDESGAISKRTELVMN